MSRYFLTDAPALDPGVCWITKTSKGPFIDTGVDLSRNVIDRGRIYLSVDTIREMAQLAGLFDEGEPVSVELKKKQWYDQGYNDAIKELQSDAVNNFVERVLSSNASSYGAAIPEPSTSGGETAGQAIGIAEESTGDTLQVDKDSDGTERKSAGIGRFKRPTRVPASSSDESDFRL